MGKKGWDEVPDVGGKYSSYKRKYSPAAPAEKPLVTKNMYERFFEKRRKTANLCIEIEEMSDTISNTQLQSTIEGVNVFLNESGMNIVDLYEAGQTVNAFASCKQVFTGFEQVITFGRHKSLRFIEVVTKYPEYVSWALKEGVIKVSETLSKSLNKSILPDEK